MKPHSLVIPTSVMSDVRAVSTNPHFQADPNFWHGNEVRYTYADKPYDAMWVVKFMDTNVSPSAAIETILWQKK